MRRRDRLTRRERRQFDELVKVYFELDAEEPHAPADADESHDARSTKPRHEELDRIDGVERPAGPPQSTEHPGPQR